MFLLREPRGYSPIVLNIFPNNNSCLNNIVATYCPNFKCLYRPCIPNLLFFFSWQVIDLNTQVHYFKKSRRLLRKKLGDAEAKTLLARAVYLTSIGSNDYTVLFTSNSSTFQTYSPEKYVEFVIGNLTSAIKVIEINIEYSK